MSFFSKIYRFFFWKSSHDPISLDSPGRRCMACSTRVFLNAAACSRHVAPVENLWNYIMPSSSWKKDIQIRLTLENTSPIAFWGDTWPLSRKMSSYLASIVNYKISTFKADHTPRKQLVCHHARYNFFWDFPTPSVGLPGPIANFAAVVPSVEHQPVQKGSSKHHLAKTLFSPFLLKSSFDLLLSTLSQQNSLSQVGNSWPKTHRISWDAIQLISSISPRQLTRRLNSCMAVSLRCATSVKILRWSRAAGVPFGACNTTRSESAKPNAFLSFWSLCLVVPLRIPPAPLPQA